MKKIILIAGPSGAGKTTVSEYLTEKYGIPRVLTHTTRPMRSGEEQNVSYHFETDETFAQLHFFEHIKYGSYQYGSSRDLVSLIVDIKGIYSYIKQLGDKAYFLYVTTSTKEELKQRLLKRGDDPSKIKERLSGSELNALPEDLKQYAHILVNDNLTETKNALDALVAKLR
ncbi:MAG: AAA family ATPase [Lactobacillus crispatus]|nr:AAA family ATPase [Lactobacillus crispatus]MCT7713788.1 AAA family ATPase [Lactobacillus crispatus]